jgi:site-specific DNA-methyltransferase (adenine-specific)
MIAFHKVSTEEFIDWCERWVKANVRFLAENASLYVWLGADQTHGFQPLPEFMLMMRSISDLQSRSLISLRNQRGYGTQRNWMAVRQELLFYVKGKPSFEVQYTEIPKVLKGYYKTVGGRKTENLERSRSETIRPGNIWLDIQQVFYRLEENVPGCYAQKPLRAIDRIVAASSRQGDSILDSFAHSGTTLLSCERLGRRCFTSDIHPVFCEIAIRRLERYRRTGKLGWQNGNPFGE